MSHAIDSISIRGLRKTHLSQLASYIRARDQGEDGGWYYGPRKQFEARHEDLIKLADELDRIAADDGIVIMSNPKVRGPRTDEPERTAP